MFIQYWLVDYDTSYPAGWNTYYSDSQVSCYQNSEATAAADGTAPTIATLGSVSLAGTAASDGDDSVWMDYDDGLVIAINAPDDVMDLAGNWTDAEFAIVGDSDGSATAPQSAITVLPAPHARSVSIGAGSW